MDKKNVEVSVLHIMDHLKAVKGIHLIEQYFPYVHNVK